MQWKIIYNTSLQNSNDTAISNNGRFYQMELCRQDGFSYLQWVPDLFNGRSLLLWFGYSIFIDFILNGDMGCLPFFIDLGGILCFHDDSCDWWLVSLPRLKQRITTVMVALLSYTPQFILCGFIGCYIAFNIIIIFLFSLH